MRNPTIKARFQCSGSSLWEKALTLTSSTIGYWKSKLWSKDLQLAQDKHSGSKKRRELWTLKYNRTESTWLNRISTEVGTQTVKLASREVHLWEARATHTCLRIRKLCKHILMRIQLLKIEVENQAWMEEATKWSRTMFQRSISWEALPPMKA